MASTYCYSLSLPSIPNPPNLNRIQLLPTNLYTTNPFSCSISTIRRPGIQASNSSSSTAVQDEARKPSEEAMSIDNLCSFVNLNVGNWQGSFFQFDTDGNLLHKVSTKLAASSYGEDELINLIQTLYIKQAASSTSFSELDEEVEWAEYKIKETNMFTVDKYQQGITSTSAAGDVTTNVPWTGIKSDNLITFNGGYQMTLLPGGVYVGCPCDVGNNVAESLSFHLEFCWLEGPGKRQKLVRTYDFEGQAVSTTYFYETKM